MAERGEDHQVSHPKSGKFTGRVGGPRQQLSDDVATYVRELIVSGKARPGEFIRTEPISEALGISNTPVREGLLLLSGEGFIELAPRRGFVVSAFSRQDVHDIFWAQATLAAELTARAAKRISNDQLDYLAQLLADHQKAIKTKAGAEESIALAHEFHRTINLAANSRRLAMLLGSIVKQLPNDFYNSIEGHAEETLDVHPRILDALRKRRGKAAGALMQEHIMSGADGLIAMLERRGMWQGDDESDGAERD